MITLKKIKQIAKNGNKKIGKDALKKLFELLEKKSEEIMNKAIRNAGFHGRKVIKKEDISLD